MSHFPSSYSSQYIPSPYKSPLSILHVCHACLLHMFVTKVCRNFCHSFYSSFIRVPYFVLLNYSYKSWSIVKARDRFGICWSWRFQNTPYMSNLTKFWLKYLRLKTHDPFFYFPDNWFVGDENNRYLNNLFQKLFYYLDP